MDKEVIDILIKCGYAAVFILLSAGMFLLLESITLRDKAKERIDKVYSTLASKDQMRVEELEKERLVYGKVGKEGGLFARFLEKIDNLLVYSGVSVKYSWINTSTYVVLSISMFCLVFMAILIIFGNFVVAFLVGFLLLVIPIMKMIANADKNYKNTEKQLVLCVNLVSSMSASNTSMVAMIEHVADSMTAPLSGAMNRAVAAVELEGNDAACARSLCREIEHPLFVRFIRHLEICSRNDSDYKTVARDYAGQVDKYLKASQRQKAIFRNGKANITVLILLSLGLIVMMASYTGANVWKMLIDMSHNMFGAFVLIYTGAVYIVAVLYMLIGMRR